MIKFLLGIICSVVFFTAPLAASENVFAFNFGESKLFSLQIAKMNHEKKYFRYSDSRLLKKYLDLPGSNASSINVFFAEYRNKKILFDTGTNADDIINRLHEINVKPEDIDIICITHMHFDHIGGLLNNYKKTFPNALVYIPAEEVEANKNSDIFPIYGKDIKVFPKNAWIIPGIKTIPTPGHTKGHTSYLLTSKADSVLVWGDIVHAPVEFAYPDVYLVYDADPSQSIATRTAILKQYSDNKTYIAGAHLLFHGIGMIKKEKTGYSFIPVKPLK